MGCKPSLHLHLSVGSPARAVLAAPTQVQPDTSLRIECHCAAALTSFPHHSALSRRLCGPCCTALGSHWVRPPSALRKRARAAADRQSPYRALRAKQPPVLQPPPPLPAAAAACLLPPSAPASEQRLRMAEDLPWDYSHLPMDALCVVFEHVFRPEGEAAALPLSLALERWRALQLVCSHWREVRGPGQPAASTWRMPAAALACAAAACRLLAADPRPAHPRSCTPSGAGAGRPPAADVPCSVHPARGPAALAAAPAAGGAVRARRAGCGERPAGLLNGCLVAGCLGTPRARMSLLCRCRHAARYWAGVDAAVAAACVPRAAAALVAAARGGRRRGRGRAAAWHAGAAARPSAGGRAGGRRRAAALLVAGGASAGTTGGEPAMQRAAVRCRLSDVGRRSSPQSAAPHALSPTHPPTLDPRTSQTLHLQAPVSSPDAPATFDGAALQGLARLRSLSLGSFAGEWAAWHGRACLAIGRAALGGSLAAVRAPCTLQRPWQHFVVWPSSPRRLPAAPGAHCSSCWRLLLAHATPLSCTLVNPQTSSWSTCRPACAACACATMANHAR